MLAQAASADRIVDGIDGSARRAHAPRAADAAEAVRPPRAGPCERGVGCDLGSTRLSL